MEALSGQTCSAPDGNSAASVPLPNSRGLGMGHASEKEWLHRLCDPHPGVSVHPPLISFRNAPILSISNINFCLCMEKDKTKHEKT